MGSEFWQFSLFIAVFPQSSSFPLPEKRRFIFPNFSECLEPFLSIYWKGWQWVEQFLELYLPLTKVEWCLMVKLDL